MGRKPHPEGPAKTYAFRSRKMKELTCTQIKLIMEKTPLFLAYMVETEKGKQFLADNPEFAEAYESW